MVLPKMLIHMMFNVKDAFLMASQPEEERTLVEVEGKVYRLVRCLP